MSKITFKTDIHDGSIMAFMDGKAVGSIWESRGQRGGTFFAALLDENGNGSGQSFRSRWDAQEFIKDNCIDQTPDPVGPAMAIRFQYLPKLDMYSVRVRGEEKGEIYEIPGCRIWQVTVGGYDYRKFDSLEEAKVGMAKYLGFETVTGSKGDTYILAPDHSFCSCMGFAIRKSCGHLAA